MKGGGVHHEGEEHAVEEGEGAVAGAVEEHEVQRRRAEHSRLHGREPGPDAARLRRRRQAGAWVGARGGGVPGVVLLLCVSGCGVETRGLVDGVLSTIFFVGVRGGDRHKQKRSPAVLLVSLYVWGTIP